MRFHTTLPVVTRFGTSFTIDVEELQDSPHPEVRQATLRGKTFVFGGVTFTPDIEALPYAARLRIFTPRGVAATTPLPGFLMTPQQHAAAAISTKTRLRAAAQKERVVPSSLSLVGVPTELAKPPTKPAPKPHPAIHLYIALTLLLCSLLGAGVGLVAAQHRRLDDVATRWARWRDNVVAGPAQQLQQPDLGVASTELREGPGGSGEVAKP